MSYRASTGLWLTTSLHHDLAEQINSEIGLKLVTSLASAVTWLKSTFFYIRVKQIPRYYDVESTNIDQQLHDLCANALLRLTDTGLIEKAGDNYHSSSSGLASAKYYVKIGTMKSFLTLEKNANLCSIVSPR